MKTKYTKPLYTEINGKKVCVWLKKDEDGHICLCVDDKYFPIGFDEDCWHLLEIIPEDGTIERCGGLDEEIFPKQIGLELDGDKIKIE